MDDLPGPPPPIPVKVVRADALDRADRAWRARVSGMTWRQVADVVGYSTAEGALSAVRSAYGSLPQIDRDVLRAIWRDRLESLWSSTVSDVADRVPGAVTAGVRVVTAAAALDGLNAPTEVNVGFTNYLTDFEKELRDAGF